MALFPAPQDQFQKKSCARRSRSVRTWREHGGAGCERLVCRLDHKLEPKVTTVRQLEVITGTGRRRQLPRTLRRGSSKRRLPLVRLFRALLASMGLPRSKRSRGVG
jgi:hypothetical protein